MEFFAAIWFFPYVMLPFALFGDYHYFGPTYLIPLPPIFGFTAARFLRNKMLAAYYDDGYAKVASDEADDVDDVELPLYEERELV